MFVVAAASATKATLVETPFRALSEPFDLQIREPANLDLPGLPSSSIRASYDALREFIVQRMDAGHLDEALRLSDDALRIAEQLGDEDLCDLAYCNRCSLARNLGHDDEPLDRLRQVLMRNRSNDTSFAAG